MPLFHQSISSGAVFVKMLFGRTSLLLLLLFPLQLLSAAPSVASDVERQPLNITAIVMFVLFVAATIAISVWAAKRTQSSSDFYNAGGNLTGLQNGTAIAGDFMSAASFLGITGLVFAFGFDGLIFAVGAFAGWPIMLFLFAKRVRNIGSYTFTDVVSRRLERSKISVVTIVGTITVVVMYLIAQMVGAGKLIELLFGLPYEVAIVTVSTLVIVYVTFGGMLATTWVQIIKAILLLLGATVIAFLVMYQSDFSLDVLLKSASAVHPKGVAILSPGALFDDPVQVATILVAMMFGLLGLPHILMRLFTVPSMREAKQSVFYASLFMAYFYLLLVIIGFGSVLFLYDNPSVFIDGQLIGGGNMAAIHLSNVLGGDLLMGFISAVAFATILAVVAGLTVSGAAAISHDLYAGIICKGNPDPEKELKLTRATSISIGVIAVALGILFQNENVAFLATMPLVVAASVNFPILFLSLFWSGTTTRGAIFGATVGLISSIGLIVVGPQVWVSVLGFESPLFPYNYPALFTMPLAFITMWAFSVTDKSVQGTLDRRAYHELLVSSEYGPTDHVKM